MEHDTEGATDATLVQRITQSVHKDKKGSESPRGQAGVLVTEVAPDPNSSLREVLLCVEWGFPITNHEEGAARVQSHTHGGPNGQPDYLDGSCLVYAEERLLDVVDFRGAHSATMSGCQGQKISSATFEWSAGRGKSAGVLHSGDVMTSDGGTHVIRVQVAGLPPSATDVFFMVSAYNCRNLSLFRPLAVRLLDGGGGSAQDGDRMHQLSELSLANAGTASAIVICALTRRLDTWFLRDFTRPCQATVRDYAPVETLLAFAQERHCRWRRRRPFILLLSLWQYGRATHKWRGPLGYGEGADTMTSEDDLVLSLLKLPTILFQCIVQLL